MRNQKTLKKPVFFEGAGVHSGKPSEVACRPLDVDQGIIFKRTDLEAKPEWLLRDFDGVQDQIGVGQRSFLKSEQGQIDTIEHIMAAIWGLGISNLLIEVHGSEIPILDGSSMDFIHAFEKAGLETQAGLRPLFTVTEPLFVHSQKAAILILPHETFRVTYTLDYDCPSLRGQTVSYEIDEDVFKKEIAPARTFCSERESQILVDEGFGKGATYQNTLVMGDRGPLENTLRFPDECARHKVLDFLGDLGLLGFDFKAQIVAVRSGHELNRSIRNLLWEQKESYYEAIR